MKKKLFALMLSCACIASNSYASLDLSNNLPRSHSIKWCLDDSPVGMQNNFELICGDAERLASLLQTARTPQSEHSPCIALDASEDSSPRPPELSQPTTAINDTCDSTEPTIAVAQPAPVLTPEMISWAKDCIISSAKTVSHWIGEPRRRTIEAAVATLIMRSRNSYSESVAASADDSSGSVSDPIRHRLVSEDYRPYDFSSADNFRLTQAELQSLACQVFANEFHARQDIEAMKYTIAQSERMCSPSDKQVPTVAPQIVVVKPLQIQTQASAYFIRQLPIDYHLESEAVAMEETSVAEAEISSESDISDIASVDLANVFGSSVLPVIDFNGIGFDVNIMSKSLSLYRYSQMNTSSTLQTFVSDQLPQGGWIKQSIYENGNRALRQSIVAGLSKLKSTLSQAQSWVESLQVAISESDESVKVANKEMLNR